MNRSRTLIVVMAALLAIQSLAWLIAWKGLQVLAQRQASIALECYGKQLPRRVFTQSFLRSVRVGPQELMLEGRLFDYKTLEERGDSLVVALYHDQKEEGLLTWIDQRLGDDKNDPQRAGALSQWLAGLLGANFLVDTPIRLYDPVPEQRAGIISCFFVLETQFQPGIPCPPPDSGPIFSFCCFGG